VPVRVGSDLKQPQGLLDGSGTCTSGFALRSDLDWINLFEENQLRRADKNNQHQLLTNQTSDQKILREEKSADQSINNTRQFDSFRSDLSMMHNPIGKLEQPICSNLSNLTTVRVMNNQQINLAVSNPVI
jgi:hypothetical protein